MFELGILMLRTALLESSGSANEMYSNEVIRNKL
jgi:hypothetical protein